MRLQKAGCGARTVASSVAARASASAGLLRRYAAHEATAAATLVRSCADGFARRTAAFLNQKSWHPLSYRNQTALFEAEAAAAAQRDADARAKEEFEAEQEFYR